MSDPYARLASIYDRFTGDGPLLDAWTEAVIERLTDGEAVVSAGGARDLRDSDAPASRPLAGRRIADLGCGTGRMLPALLAAGARVIGVDRSPAMLEEARRRVDALEQSVDTEPGGPEETPGMAFMEADLRSFTLPRAADGMIAMLDTVNHLGSGPDVLAFLERAAASLIPGGVLVFDVLQYSYFRDILGDRIYYDRTPERVLLWVNDYDARYEKNRATLTIFHREPDGRYRRDDTVVEETYYAPDQLEAWLEMSGFGDIRVDGDRLPDASGPRWLISARRLKDVDDGPDESGR